MFCLIVYISCQSFQFTAFSYQSMPKSLENAIRITLRRKKISKLQPTQQLTRTHGIEIRLGQYELLLRIDSSACESVFMRLTSIVRLRMSCIASTITKYDPGSASCSRMRENPRLVNEIPLQNRTKRMKKANTVQNTRSFLPFVKVSCTWNSIFLDEQPQWC